MRAGTLIADNVFLTAAHCTAAYVQELAPFGFAVYVTFDSPIGYGSLTNNPRVTLSAVSQVITNPAYNISQSDPGDIGVLVLRYTKPDLPRPFRVPFAWVICPLGALSCLYLFGRAFRDNWLWMSV